MNSATLLPAGLCLLLAACSGGGGDEPTNPGDLSTGPTTESTDANLSVQDALQGAWQTDCLFQGGMLPYRRTVFSVIERLFTYDESHFVDAQCADVAQETTLFGTLNATASVDPDGQGRVTFVVDRVVVTPLLSQVADSLNAVSFCGFADWIPERSFDVSGCRDREGLIAPRQVPAAWLIDAGAEVDDPFDDVLFLGGFPQGPATDVDREIVFRRAGS